MQVSGRGSFGCAQYHPSWTVFAKEFVHYRLFTTELVAFYLSHERIGTFQSLMSISQCLK
jgi:hypothetical protein